MKDEIMDNNIKLLNEASTFNEDYYRDQYIKAIDKIAKMTSTMVDLRQEIDEAMLEIQRLMKHIDKKL